MQDTAVLQPILLKTWFEHDVMYSSFIDGYGLGANCFDVVLYVLVSYKGYDGDLHQLKLL